MKKVFISYSHKDEAFREALGKQFAPQVTRGAVEIWHDRLMLAGDNFNDQILNKLQEADIVLLLISPDFLASDFCTRIEAARALERHRLGECRSIAVILRPCDWQETDLSTYLAIPTDGKPVSLWPNQDEALQNIVEAVREVLKVSVPISAEERTPFSAKNSALKPESGKESPTASNWPGYLDRVEEKFS